MSVPTTAIQIEMMQEAFASSLDKWRIELYQYCYPRLLDLISRRMFLRKPCTDDMVQMLVDLGIEPSSERIMPTDIKIRLK